MKRITQFTIAGVVIFALSGCSGGEGIESIYETHYLTDINGIGIPDVAYDCTSNSSTTGPNGDYVYQVGDHCTFFLDSALAPTDQGLYIDSEPNNENSGVNGIYYECSNYDTHLNPYTGDTIGNGHFNHVFSYDECTFEY